MCIINICLCLYLYVNKALDQHISAIIKFIKDKWWNKCRECLLLNYSEFICFVFLLLLLLFFLFYKKIHISLGPEVAKDCLESNKSSLFAYFSDCLRKGGVCGLVQRAHYFYWVLQRKRILIIVIHVHWGSIWYRAEFWKVVDELIK